MSSFEVLTAAAENIPSPFKDQSISEVIQWADDCAFVLNPEQTGMPLGGDLAVHMSQLDTAIDEHKKAPEEEKTELEAIVREKADALYRFLRIDAAQTE